MEKELLKEKSKVAHWLSLLGVIAAVFAVGWLSSGSASAETLSGYGDVRDAPPQADGTVSVVPLTEEQWNDYFPRSAASTSSGGAEGARSAPSIYSDANLLVPYFGGRMTWTFDAPIVGDEYEVARRVVEDDGPDQEWQVLEIPQEKRTNNWYDEVEASFGFKYKYRITRKRVLTPDETKYTRELVFHSRDRVFALGSGSNGVDLYIKRVNVPSGQALRVRRFESTGDVVGSPVGTVNGMGLATDLKDRNLVDGKVYRYFVEVVRASKVVTDGVESTGVEIEAFVKAGSPVLDAPASMVTVNPLPVDPITGNVLVGDPEYFQVSWEAIAGIHRSEFAMFEILRKDAKDRGGDYKIVAISTGRYLKDFTVKAGGHYVYAVRMVSWAHDHGDPISGNVIPTIPQPQCLNMEGRTDEVSRVMTDVIDVVPLNRWFAVQVKFGNADSLPGDVWCVDVDVSDWYVERMSFNYEAVSDAPCSSYDTCNVLMFNSTGDDAGYQYGGGKLVKSASLGTAVQAGVWVWYDDPFTVEPGLYKHEYWLCSYATGPQICSLRDVGPWRFADVDDIPVVVQSTE